MGDGNERLRDDLGRFRRRLQPDMKSWYAINFRVNRIWFCWLRLGKRATIQAMEEIQRISGAQLEVIEWSSLGSDPETIIFPMPNIL